MLKNIGFYVKPVRDKNTHDNVDETPVDPSEIAQIATEATIKTVVVIGGVIAANRVLKTVCEIAVVVAQAKIK